MSSTIPSGLRGDVMRKRIEDKNTLQHKGSLYVGTGESETINVNGTDYPVYETTELEVGEDNEVLIADDSAENGLKYSLINTENMSDNSITGTKINLDSCVDETLSGSYLEKAGLKKDTLSDVITIDLKEANWDADLNGAGSTVTAFHCDALTWDNKNESGTGYDFTYGNGRYIVLGPDNNYTSEKYIISAASVNLPKTDDLLNPVSNLETNTRYIEYTKTHISNSYTYEIVYNWTSAGVSGEHFGTVSCIPAMYREGTAAGRHLVLPSFNFLAVGNAAPNATITVKEDISGNIIPLGSDGFYHVPYGVLLRFDITFPIAQDPIHTPITNGYFGPSNTFVPQLANLGDLYTSDGTRTTYSISSNIYHNARPAGFPSSIPTGQKHYLSASITPAYTISGSDVDNVRIGWGLYDSMNREYIIGDSNKCPYVDWSVSLDQQSLNIWGATNQDNPSVGHIHYMPAASANIAVNNIWQGHFMRFFYDGAANQIGYYYIQYGASSNNAGGWIVIPLKGE